MRIGELAQRTGVSERMLRYYENAGLLRPARTDAGYRDYGDPELRAAQRIRLLSAAGLKLDTIRVLLPCISVDDASFQACDEIREALRHELTSLDRKLADLGESRRIVASYLDTLTAPQADC